MYTHPDIVMLLGIYMKRSKGQDINWLDLENKYKIRWCERVTNLPKT